MHRTQRSLRVRHASARLVRDLDALTNPREQHGVVANHIPTPDGRKSDGFIVTHAGHAFTPIDRADRKSTRLNSSHVRISYAVFCLKKKNRTTTSHHTPNLDH